MHFGHLKASTNSKDLAMAIDWQEEPHIEK